MTHFYYNGHTYRFNFGAMKIEERFPCNAFEGVKEPTTELTDPLEKQVGGTHYKDFEIQPIDYIVKNNLGFREGNVIKYVSRHKFKNGAEDIKKAIHYLEMILADYDE